MSVRLIETETSFDLESTVRESTRAEGVCSSCPLKSDCDSRVFVEKASDSQHTYHSSLLRSLMAEKQKYVVDVYGYKAGEDGCLLVEDDTKTTYKERGL